MKDNIEDEINRTMESLSGVGRANPKPFFYTRLIAKLERKQALKTRYYALTPRLAAASLFFCVIAAFMMIYIWRSDVQDYDMAAQQSKIDAFAKDYGYAASTLYDLK